MYGYEVLHSELAENLINSVRCDTASHAYIFEGEKGVGAFEVARLFAQTLVCMRDNVPCTTCQACTMALADTHPDIVYVKPEEGKKNITVDKIRAVTKDAYTKPFENRKKVYIIAYGDDMNEQAQNAFLKVLEEPPQYAVFVILAENNETLLKTIRSRCTLIHFPPVPEEVLRKHLEKKYPQMTEKLDFAVKFSGGVLKRAEQIVASEEFVPLRNSAFRKLELLLNSDLSSAYEIAEYLEENKDDCDDILEFWLGFVRDIILVQNGGRNMIKNVDLAGEISRMAVEYRPENMAYAMEQILVAQKMRKRYVSLRTMALRLAFLIKIK